MTGCLQSWGGPMQGLPSSVPENWAGVKEIPTKYFTYGIQVPNALSTFCDGNRLTQYLLFFFRWCINLLGEGSKRMAEGLGSQEEQSGHKHIYLQWMVCRAICWRHNHFKSGGFPVSPDYHFFVQPSPQSIFLHHSFLRIPTTQSVAFPS